jgi:hypothetical protein
MTAEYLGSGNGAFLLPINTKIYHFFFDGGADTDDTSAAIANIDEDCIFLHYSAVQRKMSLKEPLIVKQNTYLHISNNTRKIYLVRSTWSDWTD